MNLLARLNGQAAVVDAIATLSGTTRAAILIDGPRGAGKTWALTECATQWEADGRGSVAVLRGSASTAARPLHPWLSLAMRAAAGEARRTVARETLSQSAKALPFVGSVTSYLVDELLNRQRRRLVREALVLGAREQEVMFWLQRAAGSGQMLIVIDDLEFWDEDSWRLLDLCLSGELTELYSVTSSFVFVVAGTEATRNRLRDRLGEERCIEMELRLVSQAELLSVAPILQLRQVPEAELARLHAVTGGRLDLLMAVADIVARLGVSELGGVDLIDGMIRRRLGAVGGEALNSAISALLKALSVIGISFQASDAECLTGQSPIDFTQLLEPAVRENLVAREQESIRFSNDEVHRVLYSIASAERAGYHGKFAECIRLMRPGDYAYRAEHQLRAGSIDSALSCFALHALSRLRARLPLPEPGEFALLEGWTSILASLELFREAYRAFDAQNVEGGLTQLDGIEDYAPRVLLAEKAYLRAQLLLLGHSSLGYAKALAAVDEWRDLDGEEPEIWSRMMQTMIVALAEARRFDEARKLEARLGAWYWSRRAVDPLAEYGLNVVRRRAECIHSLPVAAKRLRDSAAFFGPYHGHPTPRHPIQYYYALTNLVANRIVSGQFEDAYALAAELEGLIRGYAEAEWPTLEIPAHNSILARYLTDRLDVGDAAAQTAALAGGRPGSGDAVLSRINHAVFVALAGDPILAAQLVRETEQLMQAAGDPDPYYLYFLRSNAAVLAAGRGDVHSASSILIDSRPLLDRLYPAPQATLIRRHELLSQVLPSATGMSSPVLDRILLERFDDQAGPQWAFYARGFLLTDIQFWAVD